MGKAVDHRKEIEDIVIEYRAGLLPEHAADKLLDHVNKLDKKIPKKPKNPNTKQKAAMAFGLFEESYNIMMELHREGKIDHDSDEPVTCTVCRLYKAHDVMRFILQEIEDKGEVKPVKGLW